MNLFIKLLYTFVKKQSIFLTKNSTFFVKISKIYLCKITNTKKLVFFEFFEKNMSKKCKIIKK